MDYVEGTCALEETGAGIPLENVCTETECREDKEVVV